ncbi:MAG: 2-oxo acid dehydrogenase subunit E2 [Euryarchaeota archaeon]|nr:2-oxo acid dehydrogenase subunit E2 [Euryarchaeota archaeon]
MSKYEFKLPDIGEGVVEGEIVEWHVSIGDAVKEDDPVVDIMTDKATVTIPSPIDGIVISLSGDIGDMVPVGTTLISFDSENSDELERESSVTEPTSKSESEILPKPEVLAEPEVLLRPATISPARVNSGESEIPNNIRNNERILASPAVRRRAREAGINLVNIIGSGPAGRIRHADLDVNIATKGVTSGFINNNHNTKREAITEVKVVGLRRKIAEQMVISKRTIPHFSYFEEIDVTQLEELRYDLNHSRDDTQPKLTYLPFIMMALSKIMPDHPECNAIFDDNVNIVRRHSGINLGIATQTDRGLYVPVVKNVETMDVWTAASEMQRVSGAARKGTASLDELGGSTFTITSLGRDGGLGATPIINHPEVAILGVHKAREMPVVKNGQIIIRRIMNVSSSFDHRVVDGADGAALIQHLKRMLENPALIFI